MPLHVDLTSVTTIADDTVMSRESTQDSRGLEVNKRLASIRSWLVVMAKLHLLQDISVSVWDFLSRDHEFAKLHLDLQSALVRLLSAAVNLHRWVKAYTDTDANLWSKKIKVCTDHHVTVTGFRSRLVQYYYHLDIHIYIIHIAPSQSCHVYFKMLIIYIYVFKCPNCDADLVIQCAQCRPTFSVEKRKSLQAGAIDR